MFSVHPEYAKEILLDDMKINKIRNAKMKMGLMNKILFTIHLTQARSTQCVMHRLLFFFCWCFKNKRNGQMESF